MSAIPSNPSGFAVTVNPTSSPTVHFAIPGGTYSGGYWNMSGAANPSGTSFTIGVATTPGGVTPEVLGTISTLGNFTFTNIALTPQQIADINSAAGASLAVQVSIGGSPFGVSGASVTAFTLTLIGSGGGGTCPTAFSFTTSIVQGVCYDLLTVQLLNNSGVPQNVPANQQQLFTLTDNSSGVFNPPNPVVIGAGQSSVTVAYTNPLAGTYTITATPGSGPLTVAPPFAAPQSIQALISCSPSDFNAGDCGMTRANLRDMVRSACLSIQPPVFNGGLIAGAQPTGELYPSNEALNLFIFNAIRRINTETKLETQVNISLNVPISVTNGPQFFSLTGVQANCISTNAINTIRRLTYTDSTQPGVTYRLDPTDFQYEDRMRNLFDQQPPAQPFSYFLTGYQLALLPSSQNGGVLGMYAGTAIPQFQSDSDTITQLPQDYQDALVYVTGELVCATPAGRRNFGNDTFVIMKEYASAAIEKIARWVNHGLNETQQKSIGFASYRFPTGRTSMAWRRRR